MDDMESQRNPIISGGFWALMERFAAQLLTTITAVVLARILTPDEFGTVSLVTVLFLITNVFVTDGFGAALIQKKDTDSIDYSTVLYISLIFSLCVYTVMFLFSPLIAKFYELPKLIPIIKVMGIVIPIMSVSCVLQSYTAKIMKFSYLFVSSLFGVVFSGAVAILLAYKGLGVWALVGQQLAYNTIQTIALFIMLKWKITFEFSFTRLKPLVSYGWKLLMQGLMITLYTNIRSLLIGKIYSAQDLAYYTNGIKFPNLLAVNINTALGKVLFPAMSNFQTDYSKIKILARKSVGFSSYILTPVLIGLAVCAESFTIVVLTEKWLPIVPFMRIICACLLIRPAQTTIIQAIKATGKSDVVLRTDIPIRIFGVILLFVASRYGVIYFALSEVITESFCLLLYSKACEKIINYSLREVISDLRASFLYSIPMMIITWSISRFIISSPLVILVMQVTVGVGVYLAISVMVKDKNLIYLIGFLKTIRSRGKSSSH